MAKIEIRIVGDIHSTDLTTLETSFGHWGSRLYELARGIDHNPVVANRIRKQVANALSMLQPLCRSVSADRLVV